MFLWPYKYPKRKDVIVDEDVIVAPEIPKTTDKNCK